MAHVEWELRQDPTMTEEEVRHVLAGLESIPEYGEYGSSEDEDDDEDAVW